MKEASGRRSFRSALPFAAFFAVFYLYVWLRIDPSLIYHGAGIVEVPAFAYGRFLLGGFASHPGGPAEYLAAFLTDCYYHAWVGALVITAMAALLTFAADVLIATLAGVRVPVVRFVPAILILVLYSRYDNPIGLLVGLLAAMLAVCAYVPAATRGQALRLVVFVALGALLYYLAAGAYLLYALLCWLIELRRCQGPLLGLVYLLLAEAVPYGIGTQAFALSPADTYLRLLPLHPDADPRGLAVVASLYLFFALAGLAGAVWSWRTSARAAPEPAVEKAARRRARKSSLRADQEPEPDRLGPAGMLRECVVRIGRSPAFELALIVAAGAAVALSTVATPKRVVLRINRLGAEGNWPRILQEARGLPMSERYCAAVPIVDRALYETGRLPYEMFSYPQSPALFMIGLKLAGPFTPDMYDLRFRSFFQLRDFDLRLGLVNDAEHLAHEALENFGEYPDVLRQLALVNVVKRQPDPARVFLRALTRCPHDRAWARQALDRLEADPDWSTDPDVQYIRSVAATRRSAAISLSADDRLHELLRCNPHNRMAFEYLMGSYLVSQQLDKFVPELRRLDDFDYREIPTHYQEAIVVYEEMTGHPVDLHGRQISPATRQAYDDFMVTLVPFHDRGDRAGARKALADRFGNTYFFFYTFGESGVGRR